MKIVINSRLFAKATTGIPNYINQLYSNILKIDAVNEYVFLQADKSKTLGKTITLPFLKKVFDNPVFDFFLINLIQPKDAKVFHGTSNLLPLIKKKGCAYIVTIHDLSFLTVKGFASPLFKFVYRVGVGFAVQNADIVVVDSKNTRKDILEYFNVKESKIKVVYLGVSDFYRSPLKSKRIINEKYFFSVTTHPQRKNIISVIKALAGHKNLIKYKYVIAGVIPENQLNDLTNLIKELRLEKKVIIFGYATNEQLKNLYSHAEFFIYPSFYEGFGLPVLEAMACRCPVITSDNSSLTELMPDKQWLVNPYDINDISEKMNLIANVSKNKRNELILENNKFSKNFTWGIAAKEMIEIYNSLKDK